MVRRQDRVHVVLDTNVIVRALANPSGLSASAHVYRLWLQRQIQLVVSPPLIQEYLDVLAELGVAPARLDKFAQRLLTRGTVTTVHLSRRISVERDPTDEPILSTAASGPVQYLLTLDKDLLDLPIILKQTLRFQILSPATFLKMQASK